MGDKGREQSEKNTLLQSKRIIIKLGEGNKENQYEIKDSMYSGKENI